MKDLIAEAIASCQMRIKEFQMIQKHVEDNIYDTVQIIAVESITPAPSFYRNFTKRIIIISQKKVLRNV